MTEEDNRCWPGYEPVPGKPEHSQGSCRKKSESKSTPSDKKAQTARAKQLNAWQKEHPGSSKSAAQHLHQPGTKTKTAAKKATAKKATAKKATAKKAAVKKVAARKATAKRAASKTTAS